MRATRRGIGSVRKLNSGRYQVRYTDPFGERRTGGTFGTKALAEQELSRISRAVESGTWTPQAQSTGSSSSANKVTLRDVGEQFRSSRVNRRGQSLSESTLGEYERYLTSTLSPFIDKPIRGITAAQVESWWEAEHKRAPNQASKAYKHLNQLCVYAIKKGYLQLNPCQVEGASNYVPAVQTDVPTPKQVSIMTETAEFPWKAFFSMAAWGGFRKGELLELRRKDLERVEVEGEVWWLVSVSRGVIWKGAEPIVREPKTPGSIRTVTLPKFVTEALDEHLRGIPLGSEQLLFPNQKNPSKHQGEFEHRNAWNRAKEAAGYKGRLHSLRAFAATQYGLLGATAVELMDRLGHRDIKTAMRYQRTTGREVALLRGMEG
jgi:integrase